MLVNPNRNNANLHTMVLSEKKPSNILKYEEKVDSFIRKNEKSSTVFIQHKHGIGSQIKNIDACLKIINRISAMLNKFLSLRIDITLNLESF